MPVPHQGLWPSSGSPLPSSPSCKPKSGSGGFCLGNSAARLVQDSVPALALGGPALRKPAPRGRPSEPVPPPAFYKISMEYYASNRTRESARTPCRPFKMLEIVNNISREPSPGGFG